MREFTVKINGNSYRLSVLDARQIQEWYEFSAKHLPDPIKEVLAVAAQLPDSYKAKFFDDHLNQAMEKKKLRGTIGDPDATEFMKTPLGQKKLFGMSSDILH